MAPTATAKSSSSCSLWYGRGLFLGVLCFVACFLGIFAYRYLTQSETHLAESQFQAIAQRALQEAYSEFRMNRYACLSLASVVSEMFPNATDWPFVYVNNFERIATNIMNAGGDTMGLMPLVTPEQIPEFEDFAYKMLYEIRNPPFENGTINHLPDGSFGIWGQNANGKYHDVNASGVANYGSPNRIVTPLFQLAEGFGPTLMLNIHFHPNRGKAIDEMIKCSQEYAHDDAENLKFEDYQCGAMTEMAPLVKFPDRGGANGVIMQPIYPANDPHIMVGFIPTAVLSDTMLVNLFAETVSGIDAIMKAESSSRQQAFTFTINNGIATYVNEGDHHQSQYTKDGICKQLSDEHMYTVDSPMYYMCLYPNDNFRKDFTTNNARVACILAVTAIVGTGLFFVLYDYLVRRQFQAKKDLLAAKRSFMRYVNHEVRTPMNSVVLAAHAQQHELSKLLGYDTVEELRCNVVAAATAAAEMTTTTTMDADNNSSNNNNNNNKEEEEDDRFNTTNTTQHLELFALSEDILHSTQNAVDVLSDFLNYDKIEAGSFQLDMAVIPIWQLLMDAMNEFQLPYKKKGLTLNVDQPTSSSTITTTSSPTKTNNNNNNNNNNNGKVVNNNNNVYNNVAVGDDFRLTQVLRNLLSNAMKFTPEGGNVTVTSEFLPLMDVEEQRKGGVVQSGGHNRWVVTDKKNMKHSGFVVVSVKDTGAGMSSDQLSQLFQEGIQFNPKELQKGGGSGFGLYIAKSIVTLHEGTLVASSEGIGHGTTFTLTLPLYQAAQRDSTGLSTTSSTMKTCGSTFYNPEDVIMRPLRILIVDDATSNRKLLTRLLEKSSSSSSGGGGGHICHQAENGQEAVEMIKKAAATTTTTANEEVGGGQQQQQQYDTVLMDSEMPILNGPGAAAEIRRLGFDQVFIVGVTGNMLPDDINHFKACGADAVLPKPFKMSSLQELWVENGILQLKTGWLSEA